MRTLFMAFTCLLTTSILHAQFKTVAEGPVFNEPESGYSKILLLKNGTTAFFNITFKDGIIVKIYDANHQQKADKVIKPAYGKLKRASVNAIFELKGDIILLISETDGRTPVLYRLIVDGSTGELKDEKQIAELKKLALQSIGFTTQNIPLSSFYVRKDPYSDNYAVAMFNSSETDRSKIIEVVLYANDHKEISRGMYESPDETYKYIRYIDMTVIGDKKVSIMAVAHNARKNKESQLLLANLNAGESKLSIKELTFAQDRQVEWGLTRYNPLTKKVLLVVAAKVVDKKYEYEPFLCKIDPFSQKIESSVVLNPEGLTEKYYGMPQNLFINKDGSFTIVYEDMEVRSGTTGSRNQMSYLETRLGKIAISLYDKNEKHQISYLIKKAQFLNGIGLEPFYLSNREGAAQSMFYGSQFKSFAYLNGGTKNYVLLNDIEKNRESTRGDKLTPISGLGECDGYYFDVSGSATEPERNFVFGKPADKKIHNMALFAISDYNSDANIYTTLKLEKNGKEKGVRVIWLQP